MVVGSCPTLGANYVTGGYSAEELLGTGLYLMVILFVFSYSYFTVTPAGDVIITGDPDDLVDPVYYLAAAARDDGSPPRQDSALVVVTFEGGTLPVAAAGQTNLVVIIILGVLAGCLLLIIIVLCIYIYRKYVYFYMYEFINNFLEYFTFSLFSSVFNMHVKCIILQCI